MRNEKEEIQVMNTSEVSRLENALAFYVISGIFLTTYRYPFPLACDQQMEGNTKLMEFTNCEQWRQNILERESEEEEEEVVVYYWSNKHELLIRVNRASKTPPRGQLNLVDKRYVRNV